MAKFTLEDVNYTVMDRKQYKNFLLENVPEEDSEEFDTIASFVKKNETIGGKPDRKPYRVGGKGKWTIGIGHELKNQNRIPNEWTDEHSYNQFKEDLTEKIATTKRLFKSYDDYPVDVKKSLVDGTFRGEFKEGHKTVKYINEGKWGLVPDEYIDRDDYRESIAEGSKTPGVATRMDEKAGIFKQYGESLNEDLITDLAKETTDRGALGRERTPKFTLSDVGEQPKFTLSDVEQTPQEESEFNWSVPDTELRADTTEKEPRSFTGKMWNILKKPFESTPDEKSADAWFNYALGEQIGARPADVADLSQEEKRAILGEMGIHTDPGEYEFYSKYIGYSAALLAPTFAGAAGAGALKQVPMMLLKGTAWWTGLHLSISQAIKGVKGVQDDGLIGGVKGATNFLDLSPENRAMLKEHLGSVFSGDEKKDNLLGAVQDVFRMLDIKDISDFASPNATTQEKELLKVIQLAGEMLTLRFFKPDLAKHLKAAMRTGTQNTSDIANVLATSARQIKANRLSRADFLKFMQSGKNIKPVTHKEAVRLYNDLMGYIKDTGAKSIKPEYITEYLFAKQVQRPGLVAQAGSGQVAEPTILSQQVVKPIAQPTQVPIEVPSKIPTAKVPGIPINVESKGEEITQPKADLSQQAKGKSLDEFLAEYSLFHGTPAEIEGGKLKFGAGKQLKKGGYMGGHFLTDKKEAAQAFQFGGKIYRASGDIKNKVFNVNKNKKLFKDFIGKKFENQDGEMETFTQNHYDFMFPSGQDADWATVEGSLVEFIAKKKGMIGFTIKEYAGGVDATTYQLFEDEIPIYTEKDLTSIWNKAQEKPLEQEGKEIVKTDSYVPKDSEPFKFSFIRNTTKSANYGKRFGQDVEPHGRYMVVGDKKYIEGDKNWEHGIIEFKKPLVIDFGAGYEETSNWKNVLSNRYGGKTGASLTKAIKKDGYDGIVTISESQGTKYTSEVLDLTQEPPIKPPIEKPVAKSVGEPKKPDTPYAKGVKVGQKRARTALYKKLKSSKSNITEIRKDLTDYIKKLELKDKGRMITMVRDVHTKKGLTKALLRVDSILEKRGRGDAVSQLKETIGKIDTKKLRPEYQKEIKSLMDIDLVNRRESTIRTLSNTKKYLEEHPDNNMPQKELNRLDVLSKKKVGDLTTEDIKLLENSISHLVKLHDLKNSMIFGRKYVDAKEVAIQANSNLARAKKIKKDPDTISTRIKSPKQVGRVKKVATTESYNVELVTQILDKEDGGIIQKVFYGGIDEGRTKELRFLHDADDFFKEKIPFNISNWSEHFTPKPSKRTVDYQKIKLSSGRTIEITRAEKIELYLHSLNRDNLESLIEAGFSFRKRPTKKYKISVEDLNEITKLTPSEQRAADAIYEHYNTTQKDALNKESVSLNGWEVATEENYIHKSTNYLDRYKDELKASKNFSHKTLEGMGMLKQKQGVVASLIIDDAFVSLYKSMKSSAAYIGYAQPLRNAKMLLNDSSFQKSVIENYGQHYLDALKSYLVDIEGTVSDVSSIEQLTLDVINKLDIAVLGANPFVMMKQPVSYSAAATEIDVKYLNNILPAKISEMSKYSPQLRERFKGNISRELGEVAQTGAVRNFWTHKSSLSQHIMAGIKANDYLAIGKIWTAVKRETKALHPKLEDDAKWEHIRKRAEKIIRRTQPTFDMKDRSAIGRSRKLFVRLLTKYSSQRNKNYMMTRRAVENYNTSGKGVKDKISLMKKLILLAVVMPAMIIGIDELRKKVYGWVIPERKRRYYTLRYIESLLGNVYFVGNIFSSLASKIERGVYSGFDISNVLVSSVEKGVNGLVEIYNTIDQLQSKERYKSGDKKGELKWKTAIKKALDYNISFLTKFRGIPYDTLKKLATAPFREKETTSKWSKKKTSIKKSKWGKK